MTGYALLLLAPVASGLLIAVAIFLMNGLREGRERRHMELREARRLDRATLPPGPTADSRDQRIAS
jgi:hypothetical protein